MTREATGQGHGLVRSAAWVVAAGALLSGPVAMLIVSITHPQPAWSGPETFRANYHPIQTIPYLLGFGLLTGFVLFTAACHAFARPEQRARTTAALVFTAIYASLVFLNYTLQVGFVPRMLALDPAAVASLTMANPTSLAWFLEMFGYAALGMATWLVAPLFEGGGRARIVRVLLQANGFLSIAGAVCTATYERWVFSLAGLVSFAGWNVLIVVCFTLIGLSRGRAATVVMYGRTLEPEPTHQHHGRQ